MAADQASIADFFLMSPEEKNEAQEAIMNAGWERGSRQIPNWP